MGSEERSCENCALLAKPYISILPYCEEFVKPHKVCRNWQPRGD